MGADHYNVWLPDEEFWRCPDHPSLPRTGVCPHCLRLRLLRLCPFCASDLPCSCSSSSSSSSFSSSTTTSSSSSLDHPPISYLLQIEPPFRRSRAQRTWSSFLLRPFRSAKKPVPLVAEEEDTKPSSRMHRSRSVGGAVAKAAAPHVVPPRHSCSSFSSSAAAGKATRSWYFPSPMKAFALRGGGGGGKHEAVGLQHHHQRSPICRG